MSGPPADRPRMPGSYGILAPEEGSGLGSWAQVDGRVTAARNYWVGTTGPDGRPHAMPVWGVWMDGTLCFATDRQSKKARNLAANPACVVHLESGDDVVILEGVAEEVADPRRRAVIDDRYVAKYGVRFAEVPGDVSIWGMRPRVAFAWHEKDFTGSATRWVFGDER
jgi:Pyridoxamine 5'-phosphate oxidase